MKPKYRSLAGYKEGARGIHVHLSELRRTGRDDSGSYKHQHKEEEAVYILEGAAVYDLDGKKKKVSAGRLIFFPSGIRHGIENIPGKALKYLVIRSVVPGGAPCCCGKDIPPKLPK